MSRHRFFGNQEIDPNALDACLAKEDLHHAVRVLRLQAGEEVDLVDTASRTYRLRLTTVSQDEVSGLIIARETEAMQNGPKLVLLQGLPRGSKVDEIIQKSVELGLSAFYPLLTKQSQIRLDEASAKKKLVRWEKIAEMAASQSKADTIASIHLPQTLPRAIEALAASDLADGLRVLNLIAWEAEEKLLLSEALAPLELPEYDEIRFLVGPEGGFSPDEVDFAVANGYRSVSLGRQILRTETAGPTILAVLGFALGRI